MYLIDTNIFLKLLLDQKKKRQAKAILEQIENGEINAIMSGYSLHSIEFILSVKRKNDILKEFLKSLNDFPNISIYHTTLEEDLEILNIAEQTGLDFDDANQYYIAKKFEAGIITFDNDFKIIQDLNIHIIK